MKRIFKQATALVGISVLFVSYQNCGKAVSYNTTETIYESASSSDPWAQMGEFAKTTQNVRMSISMGYQACWGECIATPSLDLNFVNKTLKFSFGWYEESSDANTPPTARHCEIQGPLTQEDEIDLKRSLDTMEMHQESRSRCQTDENGVMSCWQVADNATMNHSYVGNGQTTRIYNESWDANMHGDYMFYSNIPWDWFCGVKRHIEAQNNGACPAEMIDERLRSVFTMPSAEEMPGSCP